ncbi:MAG: hypothetical protein WCW35_08955 [Bacteroidota bacterium]
MNLIEIFLPLIDLILKTVLYIVVIRMRKLEVSIKTCAICAGASILAGMIPFPEALHLMLTIVIAGFLIMKDADVDFFPDGVLIPFVVEIGGAFLLRFALVPLIESL